MNKLGESRLTDELSNSLKSKVDFFLNNIEVENEHMINLLQEYMIDKDLQHLTYLNETLTLFEFTEVIRRVQSKLEQLKGSSIYALNANAHVLTLQRSLSSEASISSGLNEDFAAVEALTTTSGSGIFYWQDQNQHDRMFLAISYPGVKLTPIEPGFILSIELNLEAMKHALIAFHDYEQSGAALIHTKNSMVLTNNKDRDDMLPELKQMLMEKYKKHMYEGVESFNYEKKEYVIAYKYSPTLDYYLISYIPLEQMLGAIDTYSNLLWVLSFISFFIIIAYSYWIYRLIHRPLQNLIKAFRRVEHGQLSPIVLPKTNDEFLYLFQRFNIMMENLNVLIQQVYEQRLRAQSSELKQLQAQINPHFLYNTYFILYRLAKLNDNESIAHFSQYLGEYFQYITRNATEEVSLESEIRHSKTYAEIQKIRFKGRIQVEFAELPSHCKSIVVPRLILQPLIENSYKHGLEVRRKNGLIRVGVHTEGNDLFISVEDNGDPLSVEQLQQLNNSLDLHGDELEYTGLLNVHRRLQIRFGIHYGITVAHSELGGLMVTIKLLNKSEDIALERGN